MWSVTTGIKRRERGQKLRRRQHQLRSVEQPLEEAADPSAVA
jgi:hypothetical protein